MFNNHLSTSFIVEAIAAKGKRAVDLKPYEIALIDTDTQLTVDVANYHPDKQYEFVWKSPSKGFITPFGGEERNATLPIRSLPLGRIDRAHAFQEATDTPKPFIAYLGWDSVSACKSLNLDCGKTYGLVIRARGKNVRDVMGRNFEEYVSFTTDCCDDCSIAESAKKVVAKIYESIQKESFYLNNNFFKVEQVYDCCPASDPFPRVQYKKYQLSLCDTGDSTALAKVQRAYPTLNIERVGRKGVISTYEVCKPCVITTPDNPATPLVDETVWTCTAPAPFVTSGTTRIECDTCPSGYTRVVGGQVFIVEMAYNNTNANHLAVVQALYPTATEATLLSSNAGNGTFQVVFPDAFNGTAVANTVIRKVGDRADACVETTASTFTWVAGADAYKITRKLCVTVKNNDCDGSDRLAEIIAAYTNNPDVVQGSIAVKTAADCNTVYELEQYNNACLQDGCDTFGADGAKFNQVDSFENFVWLPCDCDGWTFDVDGCPVPPADPTLQDCRAGIKFTGAFLDNELMTCRFSPDDQINVDPITIEVSFIDPTAGDRCDTLDIPWTIVQNPTIVQGLGQFVARQIIHDRMYDNHIYTHPDREDGLLMTERLGYDYGVKPGSLYHHFDVYHYSSRVRKAYQDDNAYRERITFFIEADNVPLQTELKTFLNRTLLAHSISGLLS